MMKEMERTRTIEASFVYLPANFDDAPEFPDRDTFIKIGISQYVLEFADTSSAYNTLVSLAVLIGATIAYIL